jgi:hypothetical protein
MAKERVKDVRHPIKGRSEVKSIALMDPLAAAASWDVVHFKYVYRIPSLS